MIPPPEQFHDLFCGMANYCWRRLPKHAHSLDWDDLYAEGLLAYAKASAKYDESRGVKFITILTWITRNQLIGILRSAWRTLPAYQWDDSRPDTTGFEDLLPDHGPTLREQIRGDLSDGLYRRLSREAWMVVRAVLDPPEEFRRYAHERRTRQLRTLIWEWLGYDRRTKIRVQNELKAAMEVGAA